MFEQRFVQRCSVCTQEIDFWRQLNRGAVQLLRGDAKYAVCCCCGQSVESVADAGYRRRFKKWARQRKAQQRWDDAQRQQEHEREERQEAEIARENALEEYGQRFGSR